MTRAVILHGDCREVMAALDGDSIDAVVCDPPYGLSFMGKGWDHGVPGEEFWREALRVAKPGAHLLAFGGTRTYHRLACAIEDAGWELRDCIMWVYGSGFPKSLDVSKAIDKAAGATRGEEKKHPTNSCPSGQWCKCESLDKTGRYGPTKHPAVTAPATEAARQWDGWGTALKPAWEPILVARKPLAGTVAANVLRHGTGALNIDGCRVGTTERIPAHHGTNGAAGRTMGSRREYVPGTAGTVFNDAGRWPANVIHDGSDEVTALFPQAKGMPVATLRRGSTTGAGPGYGSSARQAPVEAVGYGDHGSAARFFYCAKATKVDRDEGCEGIAEQEVMQYSERGQGPQPQQTPAKPVMQRNAHPTVKPISLMRYLVRLVTPPGGVVLDPFCGSGSTGKGALLEGMRFVGVEREAEYAAIARARCEAAEAASEQRMFEAAS